MRARQQHMAYCVSNCGEPLGLSMTRSGPRTSIHLLDSAFAMLAGVVSLSTAFELLPELHRTLSSLLGLFERTILRNVPWLAAIVAREGAFAVIDSRLNSTTGATSIRCKSKHMHANLLLRWSLRWRPLRALMQTKLGTEGGETTAIVLNRMRRTQCEARAVALECAARLLEHAVELGPGPVQYVL